MKEDISRKTLLVLVLTAIAISAVTTSVGLITLEKASYDVPSDMLTEYTASKPGFAQMKVNVKGPSEPVVSEPVKAKMVLRVI